MLRDTVGPMIIDLTIRQAEAGRAYALKLLCTSAESESVVPLAAGEQQPLAQLLA